MASIVTGAGKVQGNMLCVSEGARASVPDVLSDYLFDAAALRQFNKLTESGKKPCKWQLCDGGHTNRHTKHCTTYFDFETHCSEDVHTNARIKFKCCK